MPCRRAPNRPLGPAHARQRWPYGSHLRRLIDEPWAHLKIGDTEYLARVQAAADHSSVVERDLLYQQNEFEEVRRYLMGEYRSLNRIRTVELVRQVLEGGWQIEGCALRQISARRLEPDQLSTADVKVWWL